MDKELARKLVGVEVEQKWAWEKYSKQKEYV